MKKEVKGRGGGQNRYKSCLTAGRRSGKKDIGLGGGEEEPDREKGAGDPKRITKERSRQGDRPWVG